MPLVYLPDRSALFVWGDERNVRGVNGLASQGQPAVAAVVAPGKHGEVEGIVLPLFETMARLAVIAAADIPALPGSIATWTLASKLALDLVSRERVVPTVVRHRGKLQACWGAALSASEDSAQVASQSDDQTEPVGGIGLAELGALGVLAVEAERPPPQLTALRESVPNGRHRWA